MWPFERKPKDRNLLLESLQLADVDARSEEIERRTLRHRLELRKMELDLAELEAAAVEKKADREARKIERVLKAERTHKAREAKALKRGANGHDTAPRCRHCESGGGDPTLSAKEILWHSYGHPPGGPAAVALPKIGEGN